MGGRCVTCLVPVFSFILVENLVLTCKSIQRLDEKTGIVTECCKTNCTSGSYVEVCTVNGTSDQCVPCPHDSYLDDNTSSDLPTPCIQYNCPPGSVPADTFPKSGCHKKCQCDVSQKYVGMDPCDCKKSSVTCTVGKQLTIHNICSTIATQSLILSSSISGQTVTITPMEVGPDTSTVTVTGVIEVTPPTNDTGIITPTDDTGIVTDDRGSVLGAVLGITGVVVVVVVLMAAVVYRRRKRRFAQENSPPEIEMNILQGALSSKETANGIKAQEHSREVNSGGIPCNGVQKTTYRMETVETTQNGNEDTSPLIEVQSQMTGNKIQSQETGNITVHTEETELKKLVTERERQTSDGEESRYFSPKQGSTVTNHEKKVEPLGSTIGLPVCPQLDIKSFENDYTNSINLGVAPHLDINSI